MSITFTDQLDKPSEITTIPNQLLRPVFGALYGFDTPQTPAVPLETFDTATLENGQPAIGSTNTLTFTVDPSTAISASSTITIAGLTGSQTADSGSLTVGGAGASIFGSSGAWTQSSGTLVLTVAGGQSVPTGSDTVITFTLTNPATTNAGVTGITLASSGFTTADISGTFLNAVGNYNVTTRDTEANILASTPSNPSGEVTNAYGTDTYDLYVYDGSAWYIYNNDFSQIGQFIQFITVTNSEATILASTPEAYTIEQASDTDNLYVYDGSAWYIYNDDYTP